MPSDEQNQPWWLEPQLLQKEAFVSLVQGLSTAEAKSRLNTFGPNIFQDRQRQSLLRQYLRRFGNPLVLILLAASAVSAFTGELTNFFIISCIVVLSVTLDFAQEHRANVAVEKLQKTVSIRATVLRDGATRDLEVSQLVPGDVVLLSAGNLVPADGAVIEALDLFVKQSSLTGEPYPVEKRPGLPVDHGDDMQNATNAVFMGSSVISGSARIVVVKTGTGTAIGQIADSLYRSAEPTSFEVGTRRFGMLIMRLTILMVMFVLFVNTYFHKPWLESFLFAVALAVGLTPELLPMVVSITLSRGALRMAKRHMIVKRLSSIQDLGSMDVLCTDKTGTLTEAKIRLERHLDAEGAPSDRVLELAYCNSFFETGLKSPLDEAILAHRHIDISPWSKVDEVPFDFERRRVSVLIDNGKSRWLVVKGAADEIVGLCTHYESASAAVPSPLDESALISVVGQYHALEEEGFRVLGIAWRQVPLDHPHAVVGDETELVLAGFAAFLDPPKESAAPVLSALRRASVAIKVVTGDSERVTRYVCSQLQIPVTGILLGRDIVEMDDRALEARVESCNLFCRVNPAQKERVIRALKARGHVVGYLGDGINDAPSLHAADVGLSVDSAADVAKEAADMILLRQDLHVLHDGVHEGRRTFGNIMKYILMGTSSNFGNMFSMAGAAVFLPFLPMLPTQILLNNILYDLSEIPIPLDKVDSVDVRTPQVLDLGLIRNFMLVIGSISSMFDFLTFYIMLVVLQAEEKLFQTGWFVESLCPQVLVIFIIRTRRHAWQSHPHPALVTAALAIVAIAIILPLTHLGSQFGFVPPPAGYYGIIGMLVVAYLLVVEIAKHRFYAHLKKDSRVSQRSSRRPL